MSEDRERLAEKLRDLADELGSKGESEAAPAAAEEKPPPDSQPRKPAPTSQEADAEAIGGAFREFIATSNYRTGYEGEE